MMKPSEPSAARFEELVIPCEDGPAIHIHIDNEPIMLVNPKAVERLKIQYRGQRQ